MPRRGFGSVDSVDGLLLQRPQPSRKARSARTKSTVFVVQTMSAILEELELAGPPLRPSRRERSWLGQRFILRRSSSMAIPSASRRLSGESSSGMERPSTSQQQWPVTFEGAQLATEVQGSAGCSSETKAKLIREIMEHEGSHGTCTQTFVKKVRKQIRPLGSR
jgi:hypothetical protein